jgi:hypothetical protein
MTTLEALNLYEKALTKWFDQKRDHPEIKPGPKPDPAAYHLDNDQDSFLAQQVHDRVERESKRKNPKPCVEQKKAHL